MLSKFQQIQKFGNNAILEGFYRKNPKVLTVISTIITIKSVGNYKTQFGLIPFQEDTTSLEDPVSI